MNLKMWVPKKRGPMTIASIWSAGVITAFILLVLALWADYALYKNFVSEKESVAGGGSASTLKKINLERAGAKLRESKAFLENPTFPFAPNPF